jgi:nucleoside-diphosphate-sugar epimerase
MSRGPDILIAGCGYVGGRLAELLAADGRRVYALRRGEAATRPGVTSVRADLGDLDSLRVLPAAVDAVVFAAGPSSPDESGYRRIFLDGLRNLLEALAKRSSPPRRLIFTSSTAVYAQSDGEWVDETSPTEPRNFRGKVLLEAESMVHASSIPGSVLRLGGIYGPGRNWPVERVKSGEARIRSGEPHYTNRIHRDDAAGAIRHLLSLASLEPAYLGVDSQPADGNEVLRFLAAELGLPEPPTAARGESEPIRHSGSKRCRNNRLVSSGYQFEYPTFREGYPELLAQADP